MINDTDQILPRLSCCIWRTGFFELLSILLVVAHDMTSCLQFDFISNIRGNIPSYIGVLHRMGGLNSR